MGRKSDPQSIDRARVAAGIVLWMAQVIAAVIVWINPPGWLDALPPQGIYIASVGVQIAWLGFWGLFLFRNHLGKVCWGACFAFAGSAFLFSALNGLWIRPANLLFYLIPVLWIAGNTTIAQGLATAVLALLPEGFQWLNIAEQWVFPIPPLPGNEDPRLFSWSDFLTLSASQIFSVFILALLATRWTVRTVSVSRPVRGSGSAAPHRFAENTAMEAASQTQSRETGGVSVVSEVNLEQIVGAERDSGLRGILESIVYFMSKNFKAHSALGFLSLDEGHTFVINAKYTKSQYVKDNVLVYAGSGIVGKAIHEPNGFMSGNVKTYPDKVEYYTRLEEVNSIMVTRIVEDETKKVLGLLVVDSPAIRAFDDADKDLLNRFSTVASKLISNARMRRIMESTARQNEIVYEISKLLVAENSVRGVIGVLIENLRKVFDADRLIVCDYSAEHGKGRVLRVIGEQVGVEEGQLFDVQDPYSLYAMVFQNKIEYLETEVLRENRYRFFPSETAETSPAEVMVAPLLDEQKNCVAVLGLESMRNGVFQKRSIVLLQTIMANASSALGRARAYQRIKEQAILDGLTRIPNHRHFQEVLDKVIAVSLERKKPFGLLLMDIDHFKKFNDTYGHPVGDRVLQVVAATIVKTIRPSSDFVARYGGEEFTVILDVDPPQLAQAAERIRQSIEAQTIEHEGKPLKVTVSVGAASFPLDAQVKKDLIDAADQAMYHSKKNGRNRVTLWSAIKT